MKKIIGGEFQIDDCLLNINKSSKKAIVLSSGRGALSYILKNIENKYNYTDILIPNYLCDSITNTIVDLNWKYHFYNINQELEFDINEVINQKKANIILIINYFGMINLNKKIIEIKKKNPDMIIIEDDVQAYFEYEKSVADYSFTSLRKWFPCPDGALIKTMHDMEPFKGNISKWSEYKFAGNILKKYSDKLEDDLIALKLLEEGETLLNKEYYSMCSKFFFNYFFKYQYKRSSKKRKKMQDFCMKAYQI